MPHAPGTRLGGICDLESLRMRCVIDVDGCWHIRMADGRQMPRHRQRVWLYGGTTTTPTRAAWEFHTGKPVRAGRVVYRVCESWDCCNPAHLRCGEKRSEFAIHMARGTYRQACVRSRSYRNSQSQSKMTAELRMWAVESGQSGVVVAHALGMSQSRINAIRSEYRKRAVTAAPSVFAIGIPDNDGRRSNGRKPSAQEAA